MATSQPAVLPPPTSSGTIGSNGSHVPQGGGPMVPPALPSNPNGGMPNGYMNGDGRVASHQVPQGGVPPPSNGGPPPAGPYGPYSGGPFQGGYPPAAQKPMMPPSSGGGYSGGPRFPSGQSISQQGGPTPTLNSLLQNRGGSNSPQQTGPPSGPPHPGAPQRMPSTQGSQSHPPGSYGPPPPGGYPAPWGGPNEGSNYYRHPQGGPPSGPPYGHPQQNQQQQQPYPYPHHQMSHQQQGPPSATPGGPPGPPAPGYGPPPGAGPYGQQQPRYPGHPAAQPPNHINQVTGDGPQSQPGINIMTNSSASSTPVTATNPSNIPTNIHASGEISSLSRDADVQNSGIETLPGKAEASEGCPPPIPNKHEGKPSSTWTPPFVGSAGNTSQTNTNTQGPPPHLGQDQSSSVTNNKKSVPTPPPSSAPSVNESPLDDGNQKNDPRAVTPSGLRPTPSPTGSSSSRSMSPAVGGPTTGGPPGGHSQLRPPSAGGISPAGGQQMPPRPPSNNQAELGTNGPTGQHRMTTQTQQPGGPGHGYAPHSQATGPSGGMGPPPHHMMYGGGKPDSSQPMSPYGGQPPYGHYGPRGPGGQPGAYGGYPGSQYGRPGNPPQGPYPGYPGPGGQQHYSSGPQGSAGWPPSSSGPPSHPEGGLMSGPSANSKGAPNGPPGPSNHVSRHHSPGRMDSAGAPPVPHGHPHPGGYPPMRQAHPSHMMGKPGYPPHPQGTVPNSYNGPPGPGGPQSSYNGPEMPPPISGTSMPPHPSTGAPHSYPGPYPNSTGPSLGGQHPSHHPHPSMNTYGNSIGPMNSGMTPTSVPVAASPSGTKSANTGLLSNNSTSGSSGPVTGPDGIHMHDETSQQSTLSQSSDRSDGRATPSSKSGPLLGPTGDGKAPNYMGRDGNIPGGYPPQSVPPERGVPPGSPRSSAPSPGGSISSAGGGPGEDSRSYPRDIASPGSWQRTAASPVHSGSTGSKSDNMIRLYELDDNPDRRLFLDKLLHYMEERGTPLTQCPTISKQPLDLYRLYHYTKERGGYLECTKSKAWKEIAAQLGIGASSSGAYTLKKHYGKNLLAFECQFDRGGIDPAPILAQVEAAQNKGKKPKAGANNAASQPPPAPSPGSQDSRDSTTFSNSSNQTNSDASYPSGPGYGPGGPSGPPPPGPPPPGAPGYNNYPPSGATPNDIRPPSHPGYGPPGPGYGHYSPSGSSQRPPGPPGSSDHYPPPAGGYPPPSYPPGSSGPRGPAWPTQQPGFMGPPGGPPNGPAPPPSSSSHDMYNRPGWSQPSYGSPRPPYPGQNSPSHGPGQGPIPPSGPPSTQSSRGPPPPHTLPTTSGTAGQGHSSYPGQTPYPDQYQSKSSMGPGNLGSLPPSIAPSTPQVSSGQNISAPSKPPGTPVLSNSIRPHPTQSFGTPPVSSGGPPSTNATSASPSYPSGTKPGSMIGSHGPVPRPAAPSNSFPPNYGPRPPMYPGGQPAGWQQRYPSNNFHSSGDRGSWGPQNGPGPRGPAPPGQWGPHGERSTNFPGYGPKPMGPVGGSWGPSGMPGQPGMRPPYRPDMRGPGPVPRPGFPGTRTREKLFPPGSVESTPPLLLKRRKYTKVDVQPIEGWRLVMSLRSGLLMESSWALDVINVLLYDDHSFTYFGLGNMPGLLEALLEHWRASLISMFDITEDLELATDRDRKLRAQKRSAIVGSKSTKKRKQGKSRFQECREDALFADSESENEEEDSDPDTVNLGIVSNSLIDLEDKCVVLSSLTNGQNFSKRPRFGDEDIEVLNKEEELFVLGCDEEGPNGTWDTIQVECESGAAHWAHGGGNPTNHIVPNLSSDHGHVEFVRVLKESKHLVKLEKEDAVNSDDSSSKHNVDGDSLAPCESKKETCSEEVKPECHEVNVDNTKEPEEDIVDKIQRLTGCVFRDPDSARKRWHSESLEDENYMKDEPSLHLISDCHDNVGKRAVCISTILRNLSFVPGNEFELSKSPAFLAIVGKLLLLNYWCPPRTNKQRNYDRGEEEEAAESCTSLNDKNNEWWWSHLHVIRENIMVALANISGSLDLSPFDEDICRPILNGLLEWAVSSSAYAQDPFPNVGPNSPISPQRLAIEALCKLSLSEFNVDLILSTPPYTRIEKLTLMLSKKLYRYEDQVLREFSINLLYYLSAADSGVARTIALSDMTVSLLLGFIEQAEQNAMVVAQQHGVNALRDNPDSMGTSLDMLRRAASTLGNLSKHPDNVPLFLRQEQRLLALVMSQILDQGVASILSNVLYNIGAHSDTTNSAGPKKQKEYTKKLEIKNDETQKNEVVKSSEHSLTPVNA